MAILSINCEIGKCLAPHYVNVPDDGQVQSYINISGRCNGCQKPWTRDGQVVKTIEITERGPRITDCNNQDKIKCQVQW